MPDLKNFLWVWKNIVYARQLLERHQDKGDTHWLQVFLLLPNLQQKRNIKTLCGLKTLPQRIPHSQSSGSLHVPILSAPTHPSHLCSCLGRTGVTSWLPPGPPWRRGRLVTLASRTSTARELQGRWYRFQRIDASPFRNSSWQKRCPGWPLAAYMCPKHPDTFKQQY